MKHSGAGIPLLYDAGHMAFAGGDVLRVIDNHHARISHVHTKDVRMAVIDGLDRTKESFLDAVVKGAFTVPGDGSLDFEAIVKRLAGYGYEGWFVVEAEQDPKVAPPLEMAKIGHKELLRVMDAAGYDGGGVSHEPHGRKSLRRHRLDPGPRRRHRPASRRGRGRRPRHPRPQRGQGPRPSPKRSRAIPACPSTSSRPTSPASRIAGPWSPRPRRPSVASTCW